MDNPLCPKCANTATRRMKRRGLVQLRVYPLLGLYPWECTSCRTLFRDKNRGKLKRKRRSEGETHLPPVG